MVNQLPGDTAIRTNAYGAGRIGSILGDLMRGRGIGVRELCRATGVSRGAVVAWLRDDTEPRWSAVMAVADALGVSVEDLRPVPPPTDDPDEPAILRLYPDPDEDTVLDVDEPIPFRPARLYAVS